MPSPQRPQRARFEHSAPAIVPPRLVKAVILTAILGLPVLCSALAPAAADAARRCKDVVLRLPDGSVYTRTAGLSARRTSCRAARKVARARLGDDGAGPFRYYGYRCRSRGRGTTCTKGRRRVRWLYPAQSSARAGGRKRLRLRRCGTIPVVTEGVSGRGRVYGRGVSCRFARRTVDRSGREGVSPRGWTCLGSGEGVFCAPGSVKRVRRLQDSPRRLPYHCYVRSKL